MFSSKNKLTEDQLREGILSKNVLKILKDNPGLKAAAKETSDALDNLEKRLKNAGY